MRNIIKNNYYFAIIFDFEIRKKIEFKSKKVLSLKKVSTSSQL